MVAISDVALTGFGLVSGALGLGFMGITGSVAGAIGGAFLGFLLSYLLNKIKEETSHGGTNTHRD